MKEKVLILGVTGMAGHIIYQYLSDLNKYNIIGASYRMKLDENTVLIDVTNFEELEKIIKKNRPKYIINAVGVLINGSNLSTSNSILINSYLPHFLKELCLSYKAQLIHISTDCVFSGRQGHYNEDAFRDGDDIYARSKALGEVINKRDITIRTSIIGPELKLNGEGLFHWIMSQKGDVNGFANVYWSGVTTLELAKAIADILTSEISGVFHLTNGIKISKFELLVLIKKIWKKENVSIKRVDGIAKDKSFVNTKNPEMNLDKGYDEMLIELKEYMTSTTKDLYGHGVYNN